MWKLVPCVRGHSVTLHGPWKCLKITMTLGSDWLCLDSAWTSRGKRLWVPCQFSDLSIPLLLPTSRLCVSAAPWSEHHDMNLEVKKPSTLQKRAVILSFLSLMFFFLFPPFFFLKKTESLPKFGLFDVLWKEKQCYLSKSSERNKNMSFSGMNYLRRTINTFHN